MKNEIEEWKGKNYYNEFHFLLGKVTVIWNLVEANCMTLICNFLNPNDITVGFKRCQGLGATAIVNLLNVQFYKNVKNKETREFYKELSKRLKEVIENRNKYIHSIYMDSANMSIDLKAETPYLRMISIREIQKGTKSPMSTVLQNLNPLRALVQYLESVKTDTDKLFNMVMKEVPMRQMIFKLGEEPIIIPEKKRRKKWLFWIICLISFVGSI